MNVHVWNKKTKEWFIRYNVDYVVTNVDSAYFELDGKKYDTDTYEINFLNPSFNRKTCPLWSKLPKHDCSECPNANEDCIMLG